MGRRSGAGAAGGELPRTVGVFGATMLGLGSMLGTGVFVSIGIAAGIAGPSVVLAIVVAGALAICNALSSAQLAANQPTSGGTYEYGYVYLRPWLGFSAGWMFLCAKTASAATAAIGFAGYALTALGVDEARWRQGVAAGAVVVLGGLALGGMRRSSAVNIGIVSLTLLALVTFVVAGMPRAIDAGLDNLTPFFAGADAEGRGPAARFLEAAALMFVAFTGYGRIATLGEEVRSPRRTIPRAIVLTLIVSTALYLAVGLVGIASAGARGLAVRTSETVAPLAAVARELGSPGAGALVTIGACAAMLGVLLNLILGLSRVALAMGRRRDLPGVVARLSASGAAPPYAVALVVVGILALVSVGSIRFAWSLSAFTVLVYYAITNLAATRLPAEARLFHPAVAWIGLAGCLALAFWVEPRVWMLGLGVLAAGLGGREIARRLRA